MTPILVLAALLAPFSPHHLPAIRPVEGISPINAPFGSRREGRRRGGISTLSAPAPASGGSLPPPLLTAEQRRACWVDRAVAARGRADVATAVIAGTRPRRGCWGGGGSIIGVGAGGSSSGARDCYYQSDDDDYDDYDNDDDDDGEAYRPDGTSDGGKGEYSSKRQNRHQEFASPYSPPYIKRMPQPRKKELWLPWPLGAVRSDYHRFAEAERQRRRQHTQRPRRGGTGGRIFCFNLSKVDPLSQKALLFNH